MSGQFEDNTADSHSQNIEIHDTDCELCGLRLPKKPVKIKQENREHKFCCTGCLQVYTLLSESGIIENDYKSSELYQTCLKLGVIGNPEKDASDDLPPPEELAGAKELPIYIEGMWCSSCSWLVEKVLSSKKGVVHAKVNYASDMAKVYYRPENISEPEIYKAIDKLGYKATSRDDKENALSSERNLLMLRMGVSFFLFMNIMFFSYVTYIGYFTELPSQIKLIVPYILLFLTLPVLFWCAIPIHKKAFQSTINRAPTMEVLISISIFAAFIFSVYSLIMRYEHFYFDTVASLITIFLIGKFIENNAKHKATESIARLYRMMPKKVRLKSPNGNRVVSIEKLLKNDIFIVKEGEKIPSDGRVVNGTALVDESMLTGESKPIKKEAGSLVTAASMNLNGIIEVEALKIGEDSVLATTIKMVENALNKKSSLELTVDKISRIFIPLVIIIAFSVTAFLFNSGHTFENALLRGITVLVIACPCTLGLGTPLAIAVGIGYAAKKGILIRDFDSLQLARKINTVVFDKTGTLTKGIYTLLDFHFLNHDEKETLSFIGSLEHTSNHPIAHSIVKICRDKNLSFYNTSDIRISNGMGIEGNIIKNEQTKIKVYIGNEEFIREKGFSIINSENETINKERSLGRTVVLFGLEGIANAGYLSFGDSIKEDAGDVIKHLHEKGISTKILSGDSLLTTEAIAGQIGISDFTACATPFKKIEIIKDLQENGSIIAVVGDGINDAPALAQADIGITVKNGIEMARESSSVTLLRDDLFLIFKIIEISKRTLKVIHQNLTWAFFYNCTGIILASIGVLTPLIAAVAMLVSSLSIVGNSIRLTVDEGKSRELFWNIIIPWREKSPEIAYEAERSKEIEI